MKATRAVRAPRRRGRPIDPRLDATILDAAVREIAANGIERASLDAIAERAGVSKASMYKRWPSKDELCVAAVASLHLGAAAPDTGNPRRDLETFIAGALRLGRRAETNKILPRIVGEMVDRPGLAAAFREAVVRPRRRACGVLLERAVAAGELRTDIDRELTIDVLIGPVMFRRLVSGAPLSSTLARDVVDLVWKAFAVRCE